MLALKKKIIIFDRIGKDKWYCNLKTVCSVSGIIKLKRISSK